MTKRMELKDRRNKVMDYLKKVEQATIKDISEAINIDSFRVTHALRQLVYGEAVERCGNTYVPNRHGKSTKVMLYRITGKPFDAVKAAETQRDLHENKPKDDLPPYVTQVFQLDKPARKNQGGQGAGRTYHLGSGSWGVV